MEVILVAGKKKTNMAYCYIKVGDENILWSEVNLKTGETKIYLSQEEADYYEQKMMENVGRNMSEYIMNHPESALWGKTN